MLCARSDFLQFHQQLCKGNRRLEKIGDNKAEGFVHAREGIDSWGGKIWAESKEEQESTINILLPKIKAPPPWFAAQKDQRMAS